MGAETGGRDLLDVPTDRDSPSPAVTPTDGEVPTILRNRALQNCTERPTRYVSIARNPITVPRSLGKTNFFLFPFFFSFFFFFFFFQVLVLEQFQSSFRAVPEQFQSSFRTVLEQFLRAVSEQFQSSFRAVSEQFQSSFRAVLEHKKKK